MIFYINPIGKPRMTNRDKWLNPPRPCVKRYWNFKDAMKIQAYKFGFKMPESNYHIIAHIQMPKSWSKKKKMEFDGKPHQQKPDKDNIEKAILDALCPKDEHIWDGRVTKVWSNEGRIEINQIDN